MNANRPRLPELPLISMEDCLPYDLIRHIPGYPTEFVRQYAEAYGLAVWKAAMECAMDVCDEHANKHRARSGKAHAKGRVFAAEDIAQDLARLPLPEQGSPQ